MLRTESYTGLRKTLADPEERAKLEDILSESSPSKLFKIRDDKFAAEIIQKIDPEVWKIKSKNETRGDNLLHYFINEGFYLSFKYLLDTASSSDLTELVFEQNKAGNTPLMSSLTQNMHAISHKLWQIMQKDVERFADTSSSLNQRKMTVLHLCAQNEENKLLLQIFKALHSTKQDSLFTRTREGRTVLDICKDEDTLIQILELLDLTQLEQDLQYCDHKDRNILNHWARNNLHLSIDYLQMNISKETFKEMILKESLNGKNPIMISALHSKKESLERFLHHICFYRSLYKDDLDKILHSKDIYGDTILSLILQQSGRLDAAKNIILDMEKKYHGAETETCETHSTMNKATDEGKRRLLKCLKEHLNPSVEVQKAIDDIESSLPKSTAKKAGICFRVILKSFLVPVLVLFFDIFFDGVLVYQYSDYENDDLIDDHEKCRNATLSSRMDLIYDNETSLRDDAHCEVEKRSAMPFVCIPLALDKYSRFNYSLAFVISPWIFYYIEYCQSVYWENSVKVAMNHRIKLFNLSSSGDPGKTRSMWVVVTQV